MPIPYGVLISPDGTPDFRVTDEAKRMAILKYRLCGLCGEPLGKFQFFVGGAKSTAFYDPPSHLDCAIYAMQTCPFIVGRITYATEQSIKDRHEGEPVAIQTDPTFSSKRPDYWKVVKASGYKLLVQGQSIIMVPNTVRATPPIHTASMDGAAWNKTFEWLSK